MSVRAGVLVVGHVARCTTCCSLTYLVQAWRACRLPVPSLVLPAEAFALLLCRCEGVSAINTITSVMGVNLDTLR